MNYPKGRIFILLLIGLGFFYSCKESTITCLISSITSGSSGLKSVFYFNDEEKLVGVNSYNASITYNSDGLPNVIDTDTFDYQCT